MRFGFLAAMAVEPCGDHGDDVSAQGYAISRNDGDQGANSFERVANANGHVDAMRFRQTEVWARDGGQLEGQLSAVGSFAK